jgi:nucleoside-diphosphate-sugar epimerase
VDEVMRQAGREGVVLNFSMIYGQPEDRTVNRMLALVRKSAVIPLPDGGRHLVQPLYIGDMVEAVRAALERPDVAGASIDVAGPRAITYRAMVKACATALGRKISILPVWSAPVVACESVAGWFGATLPVIGEFARMAEDKRIDVAPMRTRLGVAPIEFEDGLKRRLTART